MKSKHQIRIGEPTAEEIKKNVGSALPELENGPEDYTVVGQDLANCTPQDYHGHLPRDCRMLGEVGTEDRDCDI